MNIVILVEPAEAGRFRATAGDPFGISTEADSAYEATQRLESMLRERLLHGSQLLQLNLGNGLKESAEEPLQIKPLPQDDWFFQTMREAIDENRQRNDEPIHSWPGY